MVRFLHQPFVINNRKSKTIKGSFNVRSVCDPPLLFVFRVRECWALTGLEILPMGLPMIVRFNLALLLINNGIIFFT